MVKRTEEWTPRMFTPAQVAEIEEAWQIAVAVMGHFNFSHLDYDWDHLLDDNHPNNNSVGSGNASCSNSKDDAENLITLSGTERLHTKEGYEDNTAIVKEAVRRDVRAFVWASHRLRHDNAHLWLPVIRQDATLVRYLPLRWRQDVAFGWQAVRANPAALYYLDAKLWLCPEILRAAWQEGPILYNTRQTFHTLFEGNDWETGDLLRYAVVELRVNKEQARNVALQWKSLAAFDRWKDDGDIIAAVAAGVACRRGRRHRTDSNDSATTSSLTPSPKSFSPRLHHRRHHRVGSDHLLGYGHRARKLSETH